MESEAREDCERVTRHLPPLATPSRIFTDTMNRNLVVKCRTKYFTTKMIYRTGFQFAVVSSLGGEAAADDDDAARMLCAGVAQ